MNRTSVSEDELWAAIGEPSRRQLLDVLLEAGEATPSTLAEALPFTRQAVSKHLAVLADAGLVESERIGREVRYSVRRGQLSAATRSMTRVAADWDQRLNSIKAIAEATYRGRK